GRHRLRVPEGRRPRRKPDAPGSASPGGWRPTLKRGTADGRADDSSRAGAPGPAGEPFRRLPAVLRPGRGPPRGEAVPGGRAERPRVRGAPRRRRGRPGDGPRVRATVPVLLLGRHEADLGSE